MSLAFTLSDGWFDIVFELGLDIGLAVFRLECLGFAWAGSRSARGGGGFRYRSPWRHQDYKAVVQTPLGNTQIWVWVFNDGRVTFLRDLAASAGWLA